MVSPTKTILCSKCKFNFHLLCTQFGNIFNFNKLGKNTNYWKYETSFSTQNFTVRKKTRDINNNFDQSINSSLVYLTGIYSFY